MIEIIERIEKEKSIEFYFVGDLHLGNNLYNNQATVKGLLQLAKDVKYKRLDSEKLFVLCLTGDIIDSSNFDINHVLTELLTAFDYIFYVRGNHDDFSISTLLKLPTFINIEGKIVDFWKVKIVGYSPSISSEDVEKLKNHLKEAKEAGQVIIIISHIPPYGHLDCGEISRENEKLNPRSFHQGDRILAEILDEVKGLIVVCGHVARQGGKSEKGLNFIFNIADFGCKKGRELNSFSILRTEWDSKEGTLKYPQFQHPSFNFSSKEEFLDLIFPDRKK
jgi:Icc-related predicted phosphoesterase